MSLEAGCVDVWAVKVAVLTLEAGVGPGLVVRAAQSEQRRAVTEKRARLDATTRELKAVLYLPPSQYDARHRIELNMQREARRQVWHARRRAEEEQRRESASEARKSA